MNDLERGIAIKGEYSAAIRSRPGVTGIGFGWRTRAQEPTDEPAIRIYVERKLPPESLSRDQVLPSHIEGIPVDVIELPPFRVQAGPPLPDAARHRPMRGGIRISPRGGGSGTLGCFAETTEGPERHVLITAQHIVYGDRENVRAERDGPAIGQPTICSWCSKCCTTADEIGDIWFAVNEPKIDAAVVELRPGMQWLAEVENGDKPIVIKGMKDVTAIADILNKPIEVRRVFRRGFLTGLVGGLLEDVSFDGKATGSDGQEQWAFVDRLMWNQVIADPKLISESGDSGGPVVSQQQEVIGIYFAVSIAEDQTAVRGLATPIKTVLDRFKLDCKVSLKIATADAPDQVRVAPALKDALPQHEQHSMQLLQQAHEQILATARGRELDAVVQHHHHEALTLVRQNKRVATVWHRNHGPEIVQHALRALRDPDAPLPKSFDGRTLDECARRIAEVFRRYGSPAFVREIDRHEPEARSLGGMTYRRFLDWLAPVG